MANFEKASRLKLRFKTSIGIISTEDLWDLSLDDLNELAKDLNRQIKLLDEEDFLQIKTNDNELIKFKFELALYILNTRKDEVTARTEASLRKIEKQRILEVLAKKQNSNLENMTEEELKKKLEELS